MPWDGTTLWSAEIRDDGGLAQVRQVAGGDRESIVQPEWSPDGQLYFVSDRSDWWNIYRASADGPVCVCPMSAEFAGPAWAFGSRWYAFLGPETMLACFSQDGSSHLARLDVGSGRLTRLDLPYTSFGGDRGRRRRRRAARRGARPAGGDRPARSVERRRDRALHRRRDAGRCRLSGPARADRVRERRRHGARLLLSADQSRLQSSAGGRAAAPDRQEPWRADQRDLQRAQACQPVLDLARLCAVRCRLWRQHGLRPALSRASERPLGRGRRRGLPERGAPPGGGRQGGRSAAWRSPAAAPAATPRFAR